MLSDAQRLVLQTHVARDRAEHLLAGIDRLLADHAERGEEPNLPPAQRHARELALRQALAAARRIALRLDSALTIAELNLSHSRRDAA